MIYLPYLKLIASFSSYAQDSYKLQQKNWRMRKRTVDLLEIHLETTHAIHKCTHQRREKHL